MTISDDRPPQPDVTAPTDLRPQFHRELDSIREDIARMAAWVTEAIPEATEILLTQDLAGADELVRADAEIDRKAFELEERCYTVIARQSPVARDLRALVSALRIIAEVERSADLAVNICKAARRMHGHRLDATLRGIVRKMGDQAHHLFKEATESYLAGDATRATALADMDEYLDDLQRELIATIFRSENEERMQLQVAVQLAVVARFYERIGDHAVNMGERTRYVVEGWGADDGGPQFVTRAAASDLE
ncbi:MAG: phosphate signaling complex protein PhoU [Desertimonas sp.]